jgi:hypothetical protein
LRIEGNPCSRIWRSRSRGARISSRDASCGTKVVLDGGAPPDKLAGHPSQVEGHQQRTVISATNLISIKSRKF